MAEDNQKSRFYELLEPLIHGIENELQQVLKEEDDEDIKYLFERDKKITAGEEILKDPALFTLFSNMIEIEKSEDVKKYMTAFGNMASQFFLTTWLEERSHLTTQLRHFISNVQKLISIKENYKDAVERYTRENENLYREYKNKSTWGLITEKVLDQRSRTIEKMKKQHENFKEELNKKNIDVNKMKEIHLEHEQTLAQKTIVLKNLKKKTEDMEKKIQENMKDYEKQIITKRIKINEHINSDFLKQEIQHSINKNIIENLTRHLKDLEEKEKEIECLEKEIHQVIEEKKMKIELKKNIGKELILRKQETEELIKGGKEHQSSIQCFLSANTSALEGYELAVQSPSWDVDQNQEPSSNPGNTSYKQLPSLVLNSTEEDKLLHGDSNLVPEEQISAGNDSIINNTGRLHTGLSNEDLYGEMICGANLNKLNYRPRKNLTDYDSRNKTQDTVKFPHIQREILKDAASSEEISAQKYASHKLESSHSVLLPEVENSSSTSGRTISEYPAASEVLKKQTFEKNNISNSISDKLEVFAGISKILPEDRPLHDDVKIDKPAVKRQPPRTINKKHIDNIRDYISALQQKRPYPHEDFPPEKHSQYETLKNYSSLRHHSPPHTSSLSSSYKHRSPSLESERCHSRYPESRRQYSPSHKRKSHSPDYRHHRLHEKSSDYNRYNDRNPKSQRSRSRSPGYYSSRSKTYDKKKSKSHKKSYYYSKKREKSSNTSGNSFRSFSLGSSSDSSNSSDESSDEKKSSKKTPVKEISKDSKFVDEAKINLESSVNTHSKQSDCTLPPEGLSQKLSHYFKDSDNSLLLDSANVDHIINAVQPPPREQQLILDFIESATHLQMNQTQQPIVASNSSTYTSPTVTDINIASNMQMPVISSSGSYTYPTMPATTVEYVTPQVPNFPQMITSAAFSAPVMVAPASPTEYGAYLAMSRVQSGDSPYLADMVTKSTKVRPSTLRNIPVSDNLHLSSNSNVTIVPDNLPLQKSATAPKTEESKSSLKYVKQPVENKTDNIKEKGTNKNLNSSFKLVAESSSSKHIIPSTAEQNKLSIIDKFKRMKAKRAKTHEKTKSTKTNFLEMASDAVSQKLEKARCADENLNNFQARLPTALQADVSKIKLELPCCYNKHPESPKFESFSHDDEPEILDVVFNSGKKSITPEVLDSLDGQDQESTENIEDIIFLGEIKPNVTVHHPLQFSNENWVERAINGTDQFDLISKKIKKEKLDELKELEHGN